MGAFFRITGGYFLAAVIPALLMCIFDAIVFNEWRPAFSLLLGVFAIVGGWPSVIFYYLLLREKREVGFFSYVFMGGWLGVSVCLLFFVADVILQSSGSLGSAWSKLILSFPNYSVFGVAALCYGSASGGIFWFVVARKGY